ncbi:AAA family ATPase [Pseudonocardia sp. KRD-184]|uniref:AAA family ATPase n=3 Tax=Pseudonocardia oceani TaxID=2792013 RepID=A0ABS6U608_9PSEU|nr:LuxR family transcriptional regulator [Pseudonocardia oceani]MBW0094905.1 AAA family ATPase [Pseudonocardia oceani]MBW0120776.1 AAA family ATPase [Pseudonocardia oceani]MBW0127657.1 AAA family ATPase [Pseudonocardia oceani]
MPQRLFGRDAELAALRGAADPRALPRPRLVVVEGEGGIGKTSLVRAFADATPVRVRWAQGAEEGAPPFWLWRQLVPEVVPDPGGDRFALFADLRDALAADGACLLVVDDVQWVDEPSLLALRTLLRDPACGATVCCATRRTGEAGPGWERVGPDLLSGPDVERLALHGLDDDAVADVLRASAGRDLDDGEVREATRASGGNPLFLRELGRLIAAGTAPARADLAEIVAARVRRLPPDAQRLLGAAALLAEEFELTVVARLLDLPTSACLPAVGDALAAGLLHDAGGGRFRFSHGLVRTALDATTPLQRAVVLHVRAARALEDLHRDGLPRVSADIARHWAAVAVTGEREPAVAWARRAAQDATHALAHEEAARLWTSALHCGGPALAADERAGLLLGLAAAQVASGRFAEALAACREAVALAEDAGRLDLVAEAALTLDAVGDGSWDRSVRTWCRRALDDPDAGPARRARLLARLAEALVYGGEPAAAVEPAARALELAEPSGDGDALVAALRARQLTCSGPDHTAVRADLATRMTALGERLRRPAVEMWGRLWAVDVAFERGDLARVAAEATSLAWCVEQQRSPFAAWHLSVVRAALAQARGELDRARELGDEGFRAVAGTGHPAALGTRLSLLGAIGHHAGYAEETFGPPGGTFVDPGDVRTALFSRLGPALALAESGRLDEAAHLYRLTGPPRDWDVPPYFLLPALAAGAGVAVLLDLPDDVAWFRAALRDRRSGHLVGGGGTASYLGPVDLVLGRCASALGDLDDAAALLADALATSERIGAPGFAVEAACELAAVRLRRREPDAARALLSRVRPDAQRMGMAPWVRRIDALLGGGAGPLTPREQEIADLVALGRSNREIADALVLSTRTVGNHVQHILTKLGFTNRSQVAAWVVARGERRG